VNLETLTTEEVFAIYRNEGGKLRRGYMCDRPKDYAVYDACYQELFQRIQRIQKATESPIPCQCP
jgi:hypothetical protein